MVFLLTCSFFALRTTVIAVHSWREKTYCGQLSPSWTASTQPGNAMTLSPCYLP